MIGAFKTTPNMTCEQSWFSSIGDYVKCTDALKAQGIHVQPSRQEEQYLLTIDFNNPTHIATVLTLLVLLIHPCWLLIKKWKGFVPNVPAAGLLCCMGILVPNVLTLFYVASRVDLNYLKAHYDHLGHPPLYGDVPPLFPVLYSWLLWACIELVVFVIFDPYNKKWYQMTYMYLQVIDRFLCIFYWQNLTCLCRILSSNVTSILTALVYSENGLVKNALDIGYYIFNIIHMMVYWWKGSTGHSSPTETTTSSWFVIPSGYQAFAIYQIGVLAIELVLLMFIIRNYNNKTTTINNNSKPIIIEEQEQKQD